MLESLALRCATTFETDCQQEPRFLNLSEGHMTELLHSHQHPDYNKRIQALENLVKKLEKQIDKIQHKLKTHRHPHTHSH